VYLLKRIGITSFSLTMPFVTTSVLSKLFSGSTPLERVAQCSVFGVLTKGGYDKDTCQSTPLCLWGFWFFTLFPPEQTRIADKLKACSTEVSFPQAPLKGQDLC
jgi:hypothetical protein